MPDAASLSVDRAAVLAHYERFADTIASMFYGIPIITLFEPDNEGDPVIRVGQLHHPVPEHTPKTSVTTRSGTHDYIVVTPDCLLWRVHQGAIGFESWTPSPINPLAVRFARLIISARGKATITMLRAAAFAARAALQSCAVDAIPVRDGRSIALFIPFEEPRLRDRTRMAARRHGSDVIGGGLLREEAEEVNQEHLLGIATASVQQSRRCYEHAQTLCA